MKTTVASYQFIESFRACGRENQFSRSALFALFDYLEAYENDCGVEIELDPIALCCEWAEYTTAVDAAKSYAREFGDESDALDFLRDMSTVIEFQSGILVQTF